MSRLNRSFIGLAVAFAAMLIVADTAAAQNPNFAGTWTLNQSESEMPQMGGGRGGMGGGAAASMVITHEGDKITITTQQAGRDGSTREVVREFITDGESHEDSSARMPTTNTAEWKEGKLVVVSEMSFDRGGQAFSMTTKTTYSINDDGRKLTMVQERETPQGSTSSTLVYDKKE